MLGLVFQGLVVGVLVGGAARWPLDRLNLELVR
ncbi:MAG: hypothetical protein ACI8PV_001499 [Dinoroseobacter sp.]|jgi:hypothetical protein